jgi:phosphoenolpyruvate synthase/pyruvate phosphate dikinase
LVGQPSSGGLVTGKARVIRSVADFKEVATGEILVFDAVQPQMTFCAIITIGLNPFNQPARS